DTRAFPLLVHDPRKGGTLRERLSLQGNPAVSDDWWVNPKTGETVDFIDFARSEGRFSKHFDRDGNPSELLLEAQKDRLENWRLLQELAGTLGGGAKPAAKAAPAAAKAAAAKPAAAKPAASGSLPGGLALDSAVKFNDGSGWVGGQITSVQPLVVSLEDETELRITSDMLDEAVKAGLIVKA
ncbi:MAG: hypothetical protein KDA42_10330, partial [Planctomycetales bacterium]|nr:hypothetical protein [Planctomycetales bacterium]